MDDRYLCPKCGSDDVRKVEMIWKEQTGDINLDSVGTTYGTGGVNVGYFKSKGTQISKMAREAAPPRKRNIKTDILGGIFLGFFLGALFGLAALWTGHKDLAAGLFWALLGIGWMYGCFLAGKDHVWNDKVWPQVYAGWQHTWICTRCGKRFSIHE